MEAAVLKDYGSDPEFGEFEEPSPNGTALVTRPPLTTSEVVKGGHMLVEGRLIQIGNSAGESIELSTRGFRNQLGHIIGHTNFKGSRELKREAFTAMCEHALAGELKVETEDVPLREIGEAWNRESPHRKLVIEVSSRQQAA